jgi:Tol biopolymer transport system component
MMWGQCTDPLQKDHALSIDYLGQGHPPHRPGRFAPGIVSKAGSAEYGGHFSPDGKEFIFTRYHKGESALLYSTKYIEKSWTDPDQLPFMTAYPGGESCFSSDGSMLYYVRVFDDPEQFSHDVFVVRRTSTGWGTPRPLTTTDLGQRRICPSVASDLSMYFSGNYDNVNDKDIYVTRVVKGEYQAPRNLGPNINSDSYEEHVFVSPDERTLLFDSYRAGGFGGGDIYVSFRERKGGWTIAQNIGAPVNTEAHDWIPNISPDGKALLFARSHAGEIDIYWCSTDHLESLQKN